MTARKRAIILSPDELPHVVDGVQIKLIPGFSGYAIDSLGNLYSSIGWNTRGWRHMTIRAKKDGYKKVRLRANGKYHDRSIYRLVLETFVGPCPPGMVCRHLDGDPGNNELSNLCWGTYAENEDDKRRHGIKLGGPTKLNEAQALVVIEQLKVGMALYLIAKHHGVSTGVIANIANCRSWKHLTGGIKIQIAPQAIMRGSQHKRSKLKESDIPLILLQCQNGLSDPNVADEFGVCASVIGQIRRGKTWKHVKR